MSIPFFFFFPPSPTLSCLHFLRFSPLPPLLSFPTKYFFPFSFPSFQPYHLVYPCQSRVSLSQCLTCKTAHSHPAALALLRQAGTGPKTATDFLSNGATECSLLNKHVSNNRCDHRCRIIASTAFSHLIFRKIQVCSFLM